MTESRRQKRVGSLIMEALSRLLIEDLQDPSIGLITVTRVEMSSDLKSARVYISAFGDGEKETIIDNLNERKGYLRKSIASKINLKYNPMLNFFFDPTSDYEKRIDELIDYARKDEK